MKILVVDDSKSIRSLIDFSLDEFQELQIVEGIHGADALNRLDEHDFDLILSDVNMPIMNGIEFTTECRKRGITCPILILTTESESSMKAKGKAAGANGWIVKPFQPEALIKTIRKFIDLV